MCILCILVHPATDCGFAMASRQRGLILQKKHAFKFFDASETKTLELRNHNLRCVAPREHFWIVECGHGRNTKGNLAYRVLGRVTFVENVALTAASVASMYSHHLCSQADFKELQSKWKKPDNIIGWRVMMHTCSARVGGCGPAAMRAGCTSASRIFTSTSRCPIVIVARLPSFRNCSLYFQSARSL